MKLLAALLFCASCQTTPPPPQTKLQSTIGSLQEKAVTQFETGEFGEALANLERIELLAKGTDDLVHLANAYNNMSAIYFEIKDYPAALKYLNLALELNRKSGLAESKAAMAENLLNLGSLYIEMGSQTKAEQHLNQAEELLLKSGDQAGLILVTRNRARILESLSEFSRAIEQYSDALERSRKIGDPRLIACILADMGGVREKMGDYPKAADLFQGALETDKQNEQFMGVAKDLNALGRIYEKAGMTDLAMEYNIRALNVYRIRINYKPWVIGQLRAIISLARKMKDKDAEDLYTKILESLESEPGKGETSGQ